jgi:poly(A) polymerase
MMKPSLEAKSASLVLRIRDFLHHEGVDSYLIGGYVRDVLLGRATKDIDIAVATSAQDVAQRVALAFGGKYVLLDEENEIARVVLIEEVPPQGGRWYLDFSTIQGNIEKDLARRDFTIDAMAVNFKDVEDNHCIAQLIDPFEGQNDLHQRLIRATSESVFRDDPARLLRAVRLGAECNFTIEAETESLIQNQSHLIAKIAGERIREELCRLLSLPNAAYFLRYLSRLGLLEEIFPELAQTKGVEQPKEHFWDVFNHSMETVAALERLLKFDPLLATLAPHFEEEIGSGVNRSTLLKLAALLHDIAKPKMKSIEESGKIRFLGHPKEGAIMTRSILERLRFSGREIKMVQKMVEYHLRPGQMANEGLPTHRAIYRYFRDTGDVAIDILILGLADHLATRGPNLDPLSWEKHVELAEYILSEHAKEGSIVKPPKLINGHDIIDQFGLKPGPQIGKLLETVKEAQGAGEIATREEALVLVQRQLERRRQISPCPKIIIENEPEKNQAN